MGAVFFFGDGCCFFFGDTKMAHKTETMAAKKTKSGSNSGDALNVLVLPEMLQCTLVFCKLSEQFRLLQTCSAVSALRVSCSQIIDRTAMKQFKDEHEAFEWLTLPAGSWVHVLKRFAKLPHKLTYELAYPTRLAKIWCKRITSCVQVFVPVCPGKFNLNCMLDWKGTLQILRCIPVGGGVLDPTMPLDESRRTNNEMRKKSRHNMVALYHNTPRDVVMLITHLNGIPLSDFACLLAVTTYMQRQTSCAIGLHYKTPRCPIPDQCLLPLEKKRRFAHEFSVM